MTGERSGKWMLTLTRLSLDAGYRELYLIQAVQGMGFGMTFVSVSTATLASVPRPRMMAASGLYNVFRQVFGSIGIAWAANLLVRASRATAAYSHGCSRQVLCYHYRFPAGQGDELPAALADGVLGGLLDDIFHAATSYFQHFWYYLELDGSWSRRPGYDQRPATTSRVIQFPGYRRNKQS